MLFLEVQVLHHQHFSTEAALTCRGFHLATSTQGRIKQKGVRNSLSWLAFGLPVLFPHHTINVNLHKQNMESMHPNTTIAIVRASLNKTIIVSAHESPSDNYHYPQIIFNLWMYDRQMRQLA